MDISVSKIYTLDQEPNIKEINRYWYDLTNKCLKRYDGSSWTPININAEDVNIITSSGSQTLSQYLNSQFSIIGDALDFIEASKANIADVVTLSGDQIITGQKTFVEPSGGGIIVSDGISSSIEYGCYAIVLNGGAVLDVGSIDGRDKSLSINNGDIYIYDGTITGAATTSTIGGKAIVTSGSSNSAVPLLKDGSAIEVYSKSEIDTNLSSKQDKLLYYSETSGDTPSATISVANIKLDGKVAEGSGTAALGDYSHAEGNNTTASGQYSHAEGNNTTAEGKYSHAEGHGTTASGNYSHAEGFATTASDNSSHAEGNNTNASGNYSHAEGCGTTASGNSSHAEGYYTITSSQYQHAQGKFNIEDANNKYADIIGNGSASFARSNAATVSWEGISWSQTDVRAGGTDQDNATHSLSAKQNSTDNSLTTTNKTIVGAINELRNSIMGAFDPITDVWTATTASSLTSIISDETYANAPGRILISPKITNVGAIRVGNNVTDINKAFPLYPDQIVSFTFSNINNFKVAADSVGDGFNYIIEFSVISPYTSQNINGGINVLGSNGSTYSITPKGNAGEETLSINLVSE